MSTSDASRTTTMTQTRRSEACPGRWLKIIQENDLYLRHVIDFVAALQAGPAL